MIAFNSFTLANGLQVVVHEDPSVQIAVMNVLYDVGSRDESPDKTGFAHLFEHLMFGGSLHIPSYDTPLQQVGGNNNAFTSSDITNYYVTVPYGNIETAFWLESDRMLGLSFDSNVLEVQRKVVIEEFKQRYLNQPYGDLWMKLSSLAYQTHPYRWPTIGKEISHVEEATMEEVNHFFYSHYMPNNAVVVVAGKVKTEAIKELAKKWFDSIPAREKKQRKLPQEPEQKTKRFLDTGGDVPAEMIYKTYPCPGRFHPDFQSVLLLSNLLGYGDSSRLYHTLVKEKKMFNAISSFVTGTIDPGLLIIAGVVRQGVKIESASRAIDQLVRELAEKGVIEKEVEKTKNQALSDIAFAETEILDRAMNLAYASLSGNPDQVNQESKHIEALSVETIATRARTILEEQRSSVLFYRSLTDKTKISSQ